MNPWLNDPNHAGFGPQDNNVMAFMQPPNTINPAQYQNQPYLNGAGRTASPAFHNSMYQTNSVVPSKRSREDSLGASPRQPPNALPGSRSQTPGQNTYSSFNVQQPNSGTPFSNAPTSFQHLQTSNNASPSPTIQQNNFSHTGAPRVATASPNPFSPSHGGHQMSPGPGDQNSRVGTPHDSGQNFINPSVFGSPFNAQQFNVNMAGQGQIGMNPMNMAQQQMQQQGMNMAQRNYQLQMQAQARHLTVQAQAQAQAQAHAQAQAQAQAQARSTAGMQGNPQQGIPNPQMNQMNHPSAPNPRPTNPEDILRSLQAFMASRGQSIDQTPVVVGRPVQLMRLYLAVLKAGGSTRLSKLNQWPVVAQQLGFPPQQLLQAGQEMQNYWIQNLASFEATIMAQQRQRAMAAQGQMQGQAPTMPGSLQGPDGMMSNHQRTQSDLMNMKMNGQIPPQGSPSINGFLQERREPVEDTPTAPHRSSIPRQLDPQQLNGTQLGSPSKRPLSASVKAEVEPEATMPVRKPITDLFQPDTLPESRYHGPINVDEMFVVGQHILDLRPVQPSLREMGVIDIHSLTMAIKSGMHAEARVALDTLVALSTEPSLQLNLVECEDLMDTLVDYAQVQVDFLGENAIEVTDDLSLSSYEEVVRACRAEMESLQDVPEFGSLQYDLDRAADRLICITTLIRNFSFYEVNFGVLGQTEVLQLLTNVIRQLGTKEMPLRTYRNTLDFMKDGVIYLSNLSTSLNIPGKQEALALLHFLLAFAPCPPPTSPQSDRVCFTMYNPNFHKYLPSAVDSLAKLLARDEPNRTLYKSIFIADANSTPPYELLTRTFGLAIATVPPVSSHGRAVIEARKPFLLQGMLAAEILVGLAPGSENPLAKSWLESNDSFAGNLLQLVSLLSSQATVSRQPPPPQPNRHGIPNQPEPDSHAYEALTHRAMAVLKQLVQKAKFLDHSGAMVLPYTVSLKKKTLLGAMIQKDMDPSILRQLCSYAGLED